MPYSNPENYKRIRAYKRDAKRIEKRKKPQPEVIKEALDALEMVEKMD